MRCCWSQVEEGTPFARWFTPGESPLPQDADAAAMYSTASALLQDAGYEHYEVGMGPGRWPAYLPLWGAGSIHKPNH